MDVHVLRGNVLDAMPRSPADLWEMLQHALQVLAQEPRMRWSCCALVLAGLALTLSRRPVTTLLSGLAVAGTGFVWLQVSQVREGDVLVRLSQEHGLTEADLLVPAVAGLAATAWLLRQAVSRYGGHQRSQNAA